MAGCHNSRLSRPSFSEPTTIGCGSLGRRPATCRRDGPHFHSRGAGDIEPDDSLNAKAPIRSPQCFEISEGGTPASTSHLRKQPVSIERRVLLHSFVSHIHERDGILEFREQAVRVQLMFPSAQLVELRTLIAAVAQAADSHLVANVKPQKPPIAPVRLNNLNDC